MVPIEAQPLARIGERLARGKDFPLSRRAKVEKHFLLACKLLLGTARSTFLSFPEGICAFSLVAMAVASGLAVHLNPLSPELHRTGFRADCGVRSGLR